jgi:hypothetical protein
MGAVLSSLQELGYGVTSSQESTGGQEGQIFTFEGTSLGNGPVSTTLTFARIVFTTNHGAVQSDGNDIFSDPNAIFGGNAAGSLITSSVSFGGASVNLAPEPGTLLLGSSGEFVGEIGSARGVGVASAPRLVNAHRASSTPFRPFG